jgi:hypothetical protein
MFFRLAPGEMWDEELILLCALNKNACEMLLVAHGDNRPEQDHHNGQRKAGWRHQRVEKKDVYDHGAKKHQRQRDKAVYEQEESADGLNAEDDNVKM